MRNTLRLLGIIALVALIGFGLIACNDGSTETKEVEKEVIMLSPIEDDFNYTRFFITLDEAPPYNVSISPKANKSNGYITIFYNKDGIVDDIPPTGIGNYLVTFNVDQDGNKWGVVKGLVAGMLTIAPANAKPIEPNAAMFDYIGRGQFKEDGNPRAIYVQPSYTAAVTGIKYFKDGDTSKLLPADSFVPITKGKYGIRFNVQPGSDDDGNAYSAKEITTDSDLIEIWEGKPVFDVDSGDKIEKDFLISGRSQVYKAPTNQYDVTRRGLNVVPKLHASQGARTLWYQSEDVPNYYLRSNLMPWEQGTYNVTMDVAAFGDYKAQENIPMGKLEIVEKAGTDALSLLSNFDVDAPDADHWGGMYDWDGSQKAIYIQPKANEKTGIVSVYFAELDDNGVPNYSGATTNYPSDAGAYQAYVVVGESGAHAAVDNPNTLKLGSLLVIVPIVPKQEDFTVSLAENVDGVQKILVDRFKDIGKGVEIGVQTYKNIAYPIVLKYKGELFNSDWANIYYNNGDINEPKLDEFERHLGPVNAGTYEVTFSLKPSKNFLTVGGVNNVAEVGTVVINQAKPMSYHYTYSGTDAIYNPAETYSYPTIIRKGNYSPDGFVVSPGEITIKYDTVHYPNTGTGAGIPSGPKGAKPTGYKITIDVAADKEGNFLAAEGLDIENGLWKIGKADITGSDFSVTDPDFHIQSAYTVEGLRYYISVPNADKITNNNWDVYYSKTAFNDAAGASNYQGFKYVPQIEGRYYARVVFAGNDNYNAAKITIRNGYLPDNSDLKPYGLVVNPLIIRNMPIFDRWLKFVGPKVNDEGFNEVKEYNVVFVLGTDDAARGDYNSLTYGPTTPYGDEPYTMASLLADYPQVPIHLNFGFDQEAELVTTFGGNTTIAAGAFANLPNIKKVTFPEGEFTLGNAAGEEDLGVFEGCTGLTEVPNNIIVIGDGAFRKSGITKLELNETLRTIGNFAFADLEDFTEIRAPDSVTTALEDIGSNAFQNTGIARLDIPDSVQTIGDAAFADCAKLYRVKFGENEIDFGEGVFPGDLLDKYALTDGTGGPGVYTRDVKDDGFDLAWTNQDSPSPIVLP